MAEDDTLRQAESVVGAVEELAKALRLAPKATTLSEARTSSRGDRMPTDLAVHKAQALDSLTFFEPFLCLSSVQIYA